MSGAASHPASFAWDVQLAEIDARAMARFVQRDWLEQVLASWLVRLLALVGITGLVLFWRAAGTNAWFSIVLLLGGGSVAASMQWHRVGRRAAGWIDSGSTSTWPHTAEADANGFRRTHPDGAAEHPWGEVRRVERRPEAMYLILRCDVLVVLPATSLCASSAGGQGQAAALMASWVDRGRRSARGLDVPWTGSLSGDLPDAGTRLTWRMGERDIDPKVVVGHFVKEGSSAAMVAVLLAMVVGPATMAVAGDQPAWAVAAASPFVVVGYFWWSALQTFERRYAGTGTAHRVFLDQRSLTLITPRGNLQLHLTQLVEVRRVRGLLLFLGAGDSVAAVCRERALQPSPLGGPEEVFALAQQWLAEAADVVASPAVPSDSPFDPPWRAPESVAQLPTHADGLRVSAGSAQDAPAQKVEKP